MQRQNNGLRRAFKEGRAKVVCVNGKQNKILKNQPEMSIVNKDFLEHLI
jgi:hypothetical protein